MKGPALFDLTGQVAVVTGGNGGIGRSIALGMAEAGAAVAVFARNEEKNQQVLTELKSIGVLRHLPNIEHFAAARTALTSDPT